MYHIRYYQQTFHPDQFRDKSWLGWWIRLCNKTRWRLEVYVQRLVLRRLSQLGELPRDERREVRRRFDLDTRAEQLEAEQTSPLSPPLPDDRMRAEQYQAGSFRSLFGEAKAEAEGEQLPVRPLPIDDMAARFGHSPVRSRRYAKGRKRFMVLDEEGDFEAVPRAAGTLVALPGGRK